MTPLHTDGSFIYSDDNTVAVMINSVFVTDEMVSAAHIVKCVNMHDDLIEAIHGLLQVGEFRHNCLDVKFARELLKKIENL